MWLAKTLILLLSCGNFITAHYGYYSQADKRGGKRYCGKELANVLFLVCGGEYNGPILIGKKSEPGENDLFQLTKIEWESDEKSPMDFPYLTRSDAQMLVPNSHRIFRRQTKGVYEECCLKACSYNELTTYCKDKSSK